MREVSLKEIYQIASNSREKIWEIAKSMYREPKVYLHWSAGSYNAKFEDYHVSIDGDGKFFVSTEDFSQVLNGTYKRNSGAVNLSLCCAAGATTNWLGTYPPTEKQIESMAECIVAVCEGLWLTIDKGHVLTHGEAAANEDGLYLHPRYACWADDFGDGNTRWDLEYLGTSESPKYNPRATNGSRGGDVLRGKALWYLPLLKETFK